MGMPHDHDTTGFTAAPRRVRLAVAALVVPLLLATAVAMLVLWPRTTPPSDPSGNGDRHLGTVVAVHPQECGPDAQIRTPTGIVTSRCGTVEVRVADGPDANRVVRTEMPDGAGAPSVRAGDDVVLLLVSDSDTPTVSTYTIVDHQRGRALLFLAVFAAAVIVGFGRWRGLAALAGLAVSFAVLLLFVLPAIAAGRSPLTVAVAGSACIMFVVLYLTHGISVRTSVAVLGTLASLVLTGALGVLSVQWTHMTGYGSEDAATLAMFFQAVDLHGLLLAGIIIGSLGVLDDITVTQAATVAELAAANPGLSRLQLYRAAARVGRAHLAAVVNTLVLAYAGASLPVLLLIVASGRPVGETLTSEFMAQEIVRSIVATIGLVAAVPITTALATLVTPVTTPEPTDPAAAAEPPAEPTARPQPEPNLEAASGRRTALDDPWRDDGSMWSTGETTR
jgi:uncharacterized membrane protein